LVYVSSTPIDKVIVDYYLHLLPGVTPRHARHRLTLLSCHDASPVSLTEKILARPRLIEKIRASIPQGHAAHIAGFNVTYLEHELALRLGVPLYGCPAWLGYWGTKSGSREVFREAGLPIPEGYEKLKDMRDVAMALRALAGENPGLRKAVVKVNDGFSGDGNAIFSFEKYGRYPNEDTLREHLCLVADDMSYDVFSEKMETMEGIAEEFIDGSEKTSPSAQCRVTPLQQVEVVSTHDQVLGGECQQVYIGCTFPANRAYASEIGAMGHQVAGVLGQKGVIGRFGIDFISVKEPGGWWKHYALEINLRKGGTTHPYLMLQFLTNGFYDYHTGIYHTPNGQERHYFATDGLRSEAYKGLTPEDLMDIAICNGLHYDATTQEGVVFHLLGALSQHGKLGTVCMGATPEKAEAYYQKTVEVLDKETRV